MTDNNPIQTRITGAVATITITREHRRNSLDNIALQEFRKALDSLRLEDVSVVVITGQGSLAFCAGSDLKELAAYPYKDAQYHTHLFQSVSEMIDEFPCATIAAIEGFCLGGGLELALACDYRIASEESLFGFPEILVGALPTGGGTVRAPRAIGLNRAREMLLFGEKLSANKALDWGLISELVPAGSALKAAQAKASDYSNAVSRESVALLKNVLIGGYDSSVRAGQTMAYLADCSLLLSDSIKEGAKDFQAE